MAVVDWKNIGVPMMVVIITGAVALISALISYIVAALFTPNIRITSVPDLNENTSSIIVSNVGSAPAKGLKLTVEAPPAVEFKEPPFSTERYTYNKTGDDSGSDLEVYIPRLIHGSGSMIKIDTVISSPRSGSVPGEYIIYATHDSGSIRTSLPVFEIPRQPTAEQFSTFSEQFWTFWNQWGATIVSINIAIVAMFAASFVSRIRKRRFRDLDL